MSRGLIMAALMAGALASGYGCLLASAPSASAELPGSKGEPSNTGRTPGGAFYVDFSGGLDPVTHVIADWDVASEWLAVSYRRDNAKVEDGRLMLRTRPVKTKVSDHTSGEFQRSGFYGYGRYEVVMQASAEPGVVSSFFTYAGEDMGDPHDEIDFELLGRTPKQVHTNFFSKGADSPLDIDLWFDASAAEHLYTIDWLPGSITWSVDGARVRQVLAGPNQRIPSTTARVMASVWAAKGRVSEWVGWPEKASAKAYYRCMSHVPVGQKGRQCSDTFKSPAR
jgi:endo-1,3-1,4-beta-glycanase ExoK